ncbi:MAG TPA: hypothetical protein VE863_14380, partial [Pyrinomonadaceae bacterium]|nr:hypothetical protein [Pyrinomonadaceae bacterium]
MVDFLLSIVGLASLLGGIYIFFFRFIGQNKTWMWEGITSIVLAVVFCACVLLLFLRHVNKEEEIH